MKDAYTVVEKRQEFRSIIATLMTRPKGTPTDRFTLIQFHNLNRITSDLSHDFVADLYSELALYDLSNPAYAERCVAYINMHTKQNVLGKLLASARRATYANLDMIPDEISEAETLSRPIPLAEVPAEKQVPLHRMLDRKVMELLSKGYFRQHTAGSLIGDLQVEAMEQRVPMTDDKLHQYEAINNRAQYSRYPRLIQWLGINMFDIVDKTVLGLGGRLTPEAKKKMASDKGNNLKQYTINL